MRTYAVDLPGMLKITFGAQKFSNLMSLVTLLNYTNFGQTLLLDFT